MAMEIVTFVQFVGIVLPANIMVLLRAMDVKVSSGGASEKITHIHHDSLLSGSCRWTGSGVSPQCACEQRYLLWSDPALSAFSHPDDEIHGT